MKNTLKITITTFSKHPKKRKKEKGPVALLDAANESATTIGQDPPAQTFSHR
jgi:hypothetical protein